MRSRGPGGQNVNKVNSAAILQWDYLNSSSLSEEQKANITLKLSSFFNQDGWIQIRSDEFRSFYQNKDRCIEKLNELLIRAFKKEKPRKATKPTRTSVKKRIESKKQRGQLKKMRQRLQDE